METLFELAPEDAGRFVRMPAARYPKQCESHPTSMASDCLYGVCERSDEIYRRRASGETVGHPITAFIAGDVIRDIYFLDEELVVRAYGGNRKPAILRTLKAGPGRWNRVGQADSTMYDANGPRWVLVSRGGA